MQRHADRPTLVVAVLTYRRPEDLAAVLPALERQLADLPSEHDARLVVVDNDPAGGAAERVRRFAAEADVDVRYEHETVPGIAAARNRALGVAYDRRLLVYIDDDERPSDGWLAALLSTWEQEGRPAAVVGPVVSTFAAEPSAFVTAGRFFDRRRMPTGTEVQVAATNNLLLDLGVVRRHGLRFDTTLGTVGGSDTLFSLALVRAGGRMVWCDEAVVVDVVPPDRVTTDWNLRRALRSGNSWSVASLRAEPGAPRRVLLRARLVGRGAARVGGGAARAGWGVVRGDAGHRARGVRSMARGSGMLLGATGLLYREYARR